MCQSLVTVILEYFHYKSVIVSVTLAPTLQQSKTVYITHHCNEGGVQNIQSHKLYHYNVVDVTEKCTHIYTQLLT